MEKTLSLLGSQTLLFSPPFGQKSIKIFIFISFAKDWHWYVVFTKSYLHSPFSIMLLTLVFILKPTPWTIQTPYFSTKRLMKCPFSFQRKEFFTIINLKLYPTLHKVFHFKDFLPTLGTILGGFNFPQVIIL